MFSPARSTVDAYRRIGVQTSLHVEDKHQIVNLLFDGVLQEIVKARGAIGRGDIKTKVEAISRALRILEEGLWTSLDRVDGGELAQNLSALYEYCMKQLVLANARNDEALLQEVQSLIDAIAQGWKGIRPQTAGQDAIPGGEPQPQSISVRS